MQTFTDLRYLPCCKYVRNSQSYSFSLLIYEVCSNVFRLTTVHEVGEAYWVLTLIVFNTVPFRSYTLRPTLLPLLETFCELLFRDV